MSDFVIDRVTTYAEQLLPSMELELVDVQFQREGHGWVLRLFIDGENGVNHDHCAMVSRELGDYLDVENIIEVKYHLEVSSPGLERPLRKLSDYKRFSGRKARIKLRVAVDGQRIFVGEISLVNDDVIELALEEGGKIEFPYDDISKARLAI